MVFLETPGPEEGHARAQEMEREEAADELREDRQEGLEVAAARPGPGKKKPLLGIGLGPLNVLRDLAGSRLRAHRALISLRRPPSAPPRPPRARGSHRSPRGTPPSI